MNGCLYVFSGQCHCGNLEIRLESATPAQELATRECQCGFCRRHGARTVADPDSRAIITLKKRALVNFYRFSLDTADFLICRNCGAYGAAVMERGNGVLATLNVNLFETRDDFQPPTPVDYESETEVERRARRAARWTPAQVICRS